MQHLHLSKKVEHLQFLKGDGSVDLIYATLVSDWMALFWVILINKHKEIFNHTTPNIVIGNQGKTRIHSSIPTATTLNQRLQVERFKINTIVGNNVDGSSTLNILWISIVKMMVVELDIS